MTSDADQQWAPPPILPKQRNAVLRIYDAPVYRDWCAWLTVGWVVFGVAVFSTSTEPRQMPVWLDVPLATMIITFLFGVLPSFLRLQIRRLLWRRRRKIQTQAEWTVINGRDRSGQEPNLRIDAEQDAIANSPAGGFHSAPKSIPRVSKTDTGDRPPIRPSRSMTALPLATDELLVSSVVLRESRQLQFPVARAVRALQLATDSKDQYEALLDVADALSVTLGTSASSWLRSRGAGQEALGSLHEAYLARGVSQGNWHQMLSQAIRLDVDGGFPSGFRIASHRTKRGTLLTHLGELVQERNRWAHGSRPRNSAEAARRVVELHPTLEAALSGSAFLAEMPWVLTRSSSYQPRSGEFHVIAFRAMGDHPEFERQNLTSAVPLADESIYLLDQQNPIDLSPFLVMRYCDTCRKRQVFYADRLDTKRGTALKSFECGHGMFDPSLDEEVLTLREPR